MTRLCNAGTRTGLFFALGLCLLTPAAALAQNAESGFPPATVVLTDAAGVEHRYEAGDVSFYVSTTEGYDGSPATTDFSMSLGTVVPIDEALLNWAAQASPDGREKARLTILSRTSAAKRAQTMRYEITGAYVSSLSLSHSTYAAPGASLSVAADTLTLDGIELK